VSGWRDRVIRSAAALVILAACQSDGITASDIFGTYTLSTVNGSPLPFSATPTEQFLSDQIVIATGVGWTETGSISITQGGQTTTQATSDGGTVNTMGTSITLYSVANSQIVYTGSFGKSSLTLTAAEFTFVFQK
jgi:hypothetical protein